MSRARSKRLSLPGRLLRARPVGGTVGTTAMTLTTSPVDEQGVAWLRDLHVRAVEWVHRQQIHPVVGHTLAYVDLSFAFGFARLGGTEQVEECLTRAQSALAGEDQAHQALYRAYEFRA